MPLNSIPPITTVKNLQGQCWSDVGIWGGMIPGNQKELPLLAKAGVKGFKCFLINSGVDEFPCVSKEDVELALTSLHETTTTALYHAELESPVPDCPDTNPTHFECFAATHPPSFEIDAIKFVISEHQKHPHIRGHIVHLCASDALPIIRSAKESGANITVETCFHHLALNWSRVPHGRPEFKCVPSIRGEENRQKLWDALVDGTIDCVVSDHSPCAAELARGY